MRVRIDDGRLDVDLITTKEEAAHVIKLALAAGLINFRSYASEDKSLGLLFTVPERAWATEGFAAMLLVAATITGVQADKVLERFVHDTPDFAAEAESFRSAVNPSY